MTAIAQSEHHSAAHSAPLKFNPSMLREDGRAANRNGRAPVGLYPEVDRGKLAAALGVPPPTIGRYMNGFSRPAADTVLRMAKALRIPVDRLRTDLGRQQAKWWQGRAQQA